MMKSVTLILLAILALAQAAEHTMYIQYSVKEKAAIVAETCLDTDIGTYISRLNDITAEVIPQPTQRARRLRQGSRELNYYFCSRHCLGFPTGMCWLVYPWCAGYRRDLNEKQSETETKPEVSANEVFLEDPSDREEITTRELVKVEVDTTGVNLTPEEKEHFQGICTKAIEMIKQELVFDLDHLTKWMQNRCKRLFRQLTTLECIVVEIS